MKKSKLITIFRNLSKKEIKELGKYLCSPIVNQQDELIHLFEYIKDCLSNKQEPNKEEAFLKIYPGKKFDDVKIRLCMSNLFKLIEQFLVYKEFNQDKIRNKIMLASIYRKRNLESYFDRTLNDLYHIQDKEALRNAAYYNNNYLIQQEEYSFRSNKNRTAAMNLQSLSDSNDLVYLAQKLKNSCFILSHQRVYKTEYHFGLLDAAIEYIENSSLLEHPAISIYYYCYQSLLNPEQEHFFLKFKTLMVENEQHFPREEMSNLFILAINYCIKRINENKQHYVGVGLELYKSGLQNALLTEDNRISRFAFNNIVAMSIKMKELEWAENFIQKYKNFLEKKHRDSTVSLNLARLSYVTKDYDNVLVHLQKSDFKDLLNNLIAKTIMMKVYFELSAFKLLESHLDTMRIFIKRKKIIGYHQQNYLNIIYFTKKLTNLNPYDKTGNSKLKTEIEAIDILTEKEWLLEMVDR